MTRVNSAELASRSDELFKRVCAGEPIELADEMQTRAVIVDVLDYRLLRAMAALFTGTEGEASSEASILRRYLGEEISLGKAAESLGQNRFQFQQRLERLGIPILLGPATVEEAQDEVANALRLA